MESLRALLLTLRRVGAGDAGPARARRILAFPVRGRKDLGSFLRVHSTLQSEFAERIGLPLEVTGALRQSYARWDGKGEPADVRGADVPLAVRVVSLADLVEVYHRTGGLEAARAVALKRSGGQLDPALVGLFRDNARELLAGLDEGSSWEEVIDAEPGLARRAGDLDSVLEAMADLVDMKSPHMAGHSRGVARLAGEAARRAGLTGGRRRRCAARWVHPRPRAARGAQHHLGQAVGPHPRPSSNACASIPTSPNACWPASARWRPSGGSRLATTSASTGRGTRTACGRQISRRATGSWRPPMPITR